MKRSEPKGKKLLKLKNRNLLLEIGGQILVIFKIKKPNINGILTEFVNVLALETNTFIELLDQKLMLIRKSSVIFESLSRS